MSHQHRHATAVTMRMPMHASATAFTGWVYAPTVRRLCHAPRILAEPSARAQPQ